ncbi:GNAT family N-acetyltransferase [Bosea psychrotolerans]|uniref:GNAT family acetyltransferase n=1 Tax=Bosea psychrotolerans TaxID=1871628 RepID=A0A2S4MB85_9HYPH|nr:GNAT family N-acetyltransferase [Bosea psychrotolerans]POR51879.1 GNAT family acetyltransferase [Bosea psychrotolerans]
MAGKHVLEIRRATSADAQIISDLIIRTLRETNARYYSPDILETVIANFSSDKVALRMGDRSVLIAMTERDIAGTASLHGNWVRSVFVRPDRQGQGIGARLMESVLAIAAEQGLGQVTVPSSVNAEGFYAKLGFVHLRDEFHGAERVILMTKVLLSQIEQG